MSGPVRRDWQAAPASGAAHPAEQLADDAVHVWWLGTARREDDLSARCLVARYAGLPVDAMRW